MVTQFLRCDGQTVRSFRNVASHGEMRGEVSREFRVNRQRVKVRESPDLVESTLIRNPDGNFVNARYIVTTTKKAYYRVK